MIAWLLDFNISLYHLTIGRSHQILRLQGLWELRCLGLKGPKGSKGSILLKSTASEISLLENHQSVTLRIQFQVKNAMPSKDMYFGVELEALEVGGLQYRSIIRSIQSQMPQH